MASCSDVTAHTNAIGRFSPANSKAVNSKHLAQMSLGEMAACTLQTGQFENKIKESQ